MDVLVTGAAGFIGSHVSELLAGAGWRVRGIDALTENYDPEAKLHNIAGLRRDPAFEFIRDDLLTADLAALLDGVDAVIHLAAEPGVSSSWGLAFDTYVRRNVLATQMLLEAAARVGVPRVVYASSSSVYAPTTRPMHESNPTAPLSPYGVSKLGGECLVGAYAHERDLSTVSLRFFSVYGPRQRPDMAAHRFIEALLRGESAQVYGQQVQYRDFTYVGDVAAAVVAAVTADVVPGTVMNIAHGTPVAVPDLLATIEDIIGGTLAVSRRPHRAGDTSQTHGDSTLASQLLGWRAHTDLRTGLERQVAWHRQRLTAPTPPDVDVAPVLDLAEVAR